MAFKDIFKLKRFYDSVICMGLDFYWNPRMENSQIPPKWLNTIGPTLDFYLIFKNVVLIFSM